MATFEITSPDGGKFEITAPDGASQADVLSYAQTNFSKAAPVDPYKQEAQAEYQRLQSKGVPVEPTLTRRVAHGATLGASDEILAGAQTPFEMIRRGTWDPREGYRSAKAWQDVQMDEARKNQGIPGHIAEIAGG